MSTHSTDPDGRQYPLPAETDHTKNFERIRALVDQQRKMGRGHITRIKKAVIARQAEHF